MADEPGTPGNDEPTDLPTPGSDDPQPGDQPSGADDDSGGDSKPFADRYKGKTAEELVKILGDKDRFISERGTEIGDLRTRVSALDASRKADQVDDDEDYFVPNYPQATGAYPQNQPAPAVQKDPEPTKEKWDFDNPEQQTRKIIREEIGALEGYKARQAFEFNVSKAKAAFKTGSTVIKRHKALFDGIEKQTKDEVYRFYLPFVAQGQPVHEFLNDEKVWVRAGQNIRLSRGEYDRIKPVAKVRPVPGVDTEHPDRVSPDRGGSAPVNMDWESDDVRLFMKESKLTKEQAEKTIRKMQEDQSKGYSDRRIK